METNSLDKIWRLRSREINMLDEARQELERKYRERRRVARTDMSEIGCAVSYDNFVGLLVEFNETSGGAFILTERPDFEGRAIRIKFHPHPDHVEELRRLHAREGIIKIEDFKEDVRINLVRELADYNIWMCVFDFAEPIFSANSPRKQLYDLMRDSLIDRLSDAFL